MDLETDGGLRFLRSWADDLDPATRCHDPATGAVIDLENIYLPDTAAGEPAAAAEIGRVRRRGSAGH